MTLRWGLAGVSNIANDFCLALKTEQNHQVLAVASRNIERSQEFAQKHHIKNSYGSYLEIARDINIDIVYISVLNPYHFDVARLMIEHNKNVLVEKPFCLTYDEAQQLFALASEKNVYILEGMWSRFFPVYGFLKNTLQNIAIKDNIREVRIRHGFDGTNNERIIRKEKGGGIVLDIGCYAIQFAIFVFKEAPISIKANGKLNSEGVDLYFEAELTFSNDRKAFLTCSGFQELENTATILTTDGLITVPTYWCPHQCVVYDKLHEWTPHESSDKNLTYSHSLGLKYEANEVYQDLTKGKKYSEIMSPEDTLLVAQISDEIRKQINVQT